MEHPQAQEWSLGRAITAGYDPETGKRIIKNVLGKTQAEVKQKLKRAVEDNTSAADQIPKEARDRFSLQDGTVFQGYLFDEGQL